MKNEWYYVAKQIYKPKLFWELIKIINATILRRLCNNLLTNRSLFYPSKVRKLLNNDQFKNYKDLKIFRNHLHFEKGPERLKIATGWFHFEKSPNWNVSEVEFEQYVSLHRWNWLLRSLTDEDEPPNFEWGVFLVRSWILQMGFCPKGKASESYTTGERIANLCIFSRHLNGLWTSLPNDLSDYVKEMGLDLSRRVEYNPGKLNGNHVINNARALLLAGHCTNTPDLIKVARAIIEDHLENLIKDCFLVEGSSHYQFLFTRWLLEMALLSEEKNDKLTANLIYPFLPSLLEGCNFFLIKSKNGDNIIPTFGDVSPDAEPEWLKDLFYSPILNSNKKSYGKGWASLFKNACSIEIKFNYKLKEWNYFQKTGWFRLNYLGWVAISHSETSSGDPIPSHCHHDFGSIVLFYEGKEILTDPGRYNYNSKGFGYYGYTAKCHNTITINGYPPMLSRGNRLIPPSYRQADHKITKQTKDGKMLIKISHNGFSRIKKEIGIHTRTFIFNKQEVLIHDQINGHGNFLIEACFHQTLDKNEKIKSGLFKKIPKNINLPHMVTLNSKNEMKCQFMIANDNPFGGWTCPSYGERKPALTTNFYGKTNLPISFTFRINK